MKHVASVSPFLSFMVDSDAKTALFLLNSGELKAYSYPDFAPKETYRIGGAGSHAAYDAKSGLLFATVAPANSVEIFSNRHRMRGTCDLHIYDVRAVLDGKAGPGVE